MSVLLSHLFVHISLALILFAECNKSWCKPTEGIAESNSDIQTYDGFTFFTRKEWNAKPWRNDICSCNDTDTTEMIPLSDPYIITIHHTATPRQSRSTNDSIQKMQSIQNFHQYTHNWCDIAYNFLIDSAGNVFQGRPFWDDNETHVFPLDANRTWPKPRLIQGSHSLNSNKNNIGVAVIGCYDTLCPNGTDYIYRFDETYTRLVQLLSWLCDYYNITPSDKTIVRHSHWKDTECPGNVLGDTKLFNYIIQDVAITMDDGMALCYDYYNPNEINQGGKCINNRICNDEIHTATDQCIDLGQFCCNMDDGDNESEAVLPHWASVYIVSALVIFVVIVLLVGFIWQKMNEHTMITQQHSLVEFTEELSFSGTHDQDFETVE